MITFWLIILVLLVIGGALLVVPAMRRESTDQLTTRDALNKAFYRDRLDELEQDEQQGVIADRPELIKELQENLLSDIPYNEEPFSENINSEEPFIENVNSEEPAREQPGSTCINRWSLLPGVAVLVVVSLGFYLQTGGLTQVSNWQKTVAEMPQLRSRIANGDAQPLTMEDVARFGLGLRTSLLDDPANVNDWMMLGRVGMALNNAATANQAFARAYALAPDNKEAKLGYAEVLTRSADPQDNRQGGEMLRTLLGQDHSDMRVLSLLAFNAFEQGQYQQAIGAWEVMLKMLPEGDKRAEVLQRSIEQAKARSGQDQVKLGVEATLSAEASKHLPPQGTLVISVSDGTHPVPVAVKNLPISRFPLSLSIDDTDAMMPERLLSSMHQVKVRARISRDGLANPQSGDWYGDSAVQDFPGNGHIRVEINQQVP